MKILVACEYSGTVRDAFRKLGHDAWSCDVLPTDSDPKYHYQCDVFEVINNGWDMLIAHPPCTYLSYAANRVWNQPGRAAKREDAMDFFMKLYNAPIKKICVENPLGYSSKAFRKPDQTIHPYYFGEPYQKRTCLWLKNLSLLDYSKTKIEKPAPLYICQGEKSKGKPINWCEGSRGNNGVPRWKARSKTFQSIADAMAQQWGGNVLEKAI